MPDDYQKMFQMLRSQYLPQQQPNYGYEQTSIDPNDPEEILKRRRRMMMNPVQYSLPNMQPQQQQDPGMASDIFSAIGNPLGGMIPGILSAIFKKRS